MQAIPQIGSVYTQDQLELYLRTIRYYDHPNYKVSGESKETLHTPTLESLVRVARLHLVAFIFENTSMHYTESHSMDISPTGIFKRLVLERQGSYCCGLNRLLMEMLRALGYAVCSVSGRVNRQSHGGPDPVDTPLEFGPPSHFLLFVQLPAVDPSHPDGQPSPLETWVVDVGFGGSGLARPILLQSGFEVQGSTATERHRLIRVHKLGDASLSDWRLQIYHVKPAGQEPSDPSLRGWRTLYTFRAIPAPLEHLERASHELTHGPNSNIFRKTVLCVKHFFASGPPDLLTNPQGIDTSAVLSQFQRVVDADDMGRVTMFEDTVRLTVGEQTCVLQKMHSEEERREAMRVYFGLNVVLDDLRYIEGREAALIPGNSKPPLGHSLLDTR